MGKKKSPLFCDNMKKTDLKNYYTSISIKENKNKNKKNEINFVGSSNSFYYESNDGDEIFNRRNKRGSA